MAATPLSDDDTVLLPSKLIAVSALHTLKGRKMSEGELRTYGPDGDALVTIVKIYHRKNSYDCPSYTPFM